MSSENIDTRTKILQATVRSLEQSGGRGARMGDIAKESGISRQAVYLHFESRADLLTQAFLYLGDQLDVDGRLAPSRAAATGQERLERYIEFWGNFLPEIYGVAKALMMARDTDEAAAAAWKDRMEAMRHGCRAAIGALHADGALAEEWTRSKATDAFFAMLQVPNWEYLTQECGWSKKEYIRRMSVLAKRSFVAG
ncbi:MAG: TetR/AcrR family transcriptional regulator [Woeseiaceae bacterium]|nr:TetR/AcrR family transcriptional regulator [Woeseiaceae bacterium]